MKDIIRKSVDFKSTLLGEDDEYFKFEGYASTFGNIDLGRDVVMHGAFKDSLENKKPAMLYQHDNHQVIGVFPETKEDDQGLFVKGIMPKNHSLAKDVYALLKCGAISSMSIGFTINKYTYNKDENIRYLDKVNLWEVSLVTFPMNERALITGVKSMEDINCMKDIERFLKNPTPLSVKQRKIFIDKIKSFGSLRDVGLPSAVLTPRDVVASKADNQADLISKKLDEILIIVKPGV